MTIHYFEYTSFIGNLIKGKKKSRAEKAYGSRKCSEKDTTAIEFENGSTLTSIKKQYGWNWNP